MPRKNLCTEQEFLLKISLMVFINFKQIIIKLACENSLRKVKQKVEEWKFVQTFKDFVRSMFVRKSSIVR